MRRICVRYLFFYFGKCFPKLARCQRVCGGPVTGLAAFRKSFAARRCSLPFAAVPVLTDMGLVLGHGSLLAHMGRARAGEKKLMLQRDEARLLALLGRLMAAKCPPAALCTMWRALPNNGRAARRRSRNSNLPSRTCRCKRAGETRCRAVSRRGSAGAGHQFARTSQAALGFDPALLKYDADQPREPAGNGRNSGRSVRVDISGAQRVEASAASGTFAGAASLLEDITPAVTR